MKPPCTPTVVALFVRIPVPGRVKTRLAGGLGQEGACRLYQAMVADILHNITSCAFPLYLFYEGGQGEALPAAWSAAAAKVIAQQGAGIGERMAAAFEHCFAENIRQVVLIGSDIPGLAAERIVEASEALASYDAAITPVLDGGYCLIALQRKRYRRELFQEIPWSTDHALRATLQRFEECTLSVFVQSALQDIDTWQDVQHYCRQPCTRARATNAMLAQLREEGCRG